MILPHIFDTSLSICYTYTRTSGVFLEKMKSNWKTLRLAQRKDEDGFEAALYLDRVPLTDHIEYTVWMERLKLFGEERNDYSKNFGWFHEKEDADYWFDRVAKDNNYKEVLNYQDPHEVIAQ